ncbi:PilC/PilY family type IV pilus protein [Kangiella marina]|uniref:VWFA domain-containing protein n=1 Tax=Kangiella marina TaxID=1079178 RepID=A0ABP8IPY2_9GAMM
MNKKFIIWLLSVFIFTFLFGSVQADDTEIYFGKPKPVNVLLVLDVSGSMAFNMDACEYNRWGRPKNSCYPSGGQQSRLEVMKDALNDFINDLPSNAKIGILTYSSANNINLLHEVRGLEEGSHKNDLLTSVDGLQADGGTLAAGAIYDAALYFRGEYGDYQSPIEKYSNCGSASNIVFLTDGEPNSLNSNGWQYYNDIEDLLDETNASCDKETDGKDCTKKLANFMSNNLQISGVADSSVKTHTIAFARDLTSKTFLEEVASEGKGTYNEAGDREQLVDAFKTSIQADIEQSMLVAPSVPLSQSNRLSTSDELFLALFKPVQTQLWPGNLKKYYLKNGVIVDKNGSAATTTKGEFVSTASSAWSSSDGNDVTLGGVAQNMDLPRNVYSNILEKNLWTNKNKIEDTNNKIESQHLGLSSGATDTEVTQHISWLINHQYDYKPNAENNTTVTVNRFGDLLHSQPVTVQYEGKSLLYVGDNEGYLHAINTSDNSGKEEWAFIPRQLLKNTSQLYNNSGLALVEDRIYGLDGDITVYHEDKNKDGIVNNGDKAYLYVGMRRGGRNYYGLDISLPNKPQLMFTITGDEDTANEVTAGLSWDSVHYYEGLGETWSKPYIGHIKWRGGKKLVMIFGGGYDSETQDNENLEAGEEDTVGNNIFIADAVSGQMLWNAQGDTTHMRPGNFDALLTNSFPSDIAAGDLRGTGTIEHFYASDTGGQVFRFDVIQEKTSQQTTIQGAKLADIQGTGVAGNRRFFTKPDISFVKIQNRTMGMIALGSGYRAHPLNEDINDRFYLFYDKKVMTREFEDDVITENTLYDVTEKIDDTNPNTGQTKKRFVSIFDILSDKTKNNGWYLRLAKGEKVLSDSSTINYRLFITTYSPTGSNNTPATCGASTGSNKLYAVSVLDGRAAFFRETQANGTIETVRAMTLNTEGIAPTFSVYYPIDGSGNSGDRAGLVALETICSGTDCDFLDQLTTLKWRELTGEELNKIKNN